MLCCREKFDGEVLSNEVGGEAPLDKTQQLAEGILTRLDLLLHVNISPADTLTRTVSQCIEAIKSGRDRQSMAGQ